MIPVVILLFGLAIALGSYLAYIGVRQHRGSPRLALTHAGIALLALSVLIVDIFSTSETYKLYNIAAFLFGMALMGGVVLLISREGRKPPVMFLVVLHATMGLFALYLLVRGYLVY